MRAWPIALLVVSLLGACGGGGGGGGTPAPAVSPIGYSGVRTTLLPGGFTPRRVATGFFDGDVYPDVAVGHEGKGGVSILLGRGDGTFEAVAPIGAGLPGSTPAFVCAAFLDLDPFADLVVVDAGESVVQTYLGRGDGTFDPALAQPIDVGAGTMLDVDVGPLDDDVLDDVVFVTQSGVHVYLSGGDGGLAPAAGSPYLAAADVDSVHVAHADTVTGEDLVLCSPSTGLVHVLRGDGNGGFAVSPMSPVSVPEGPRAAVIASIDGAFGPDLVVLTNAPGVRLFLGTNNLTFTPTSQGHGGLLGDGGGAAAVVPGPRTPFFNVNDVILLTASVGPQFSLHVTRLRPFQDTSGNVTRASETTTDRLALGVSVLDADQDGEFDLLLPMIFPDDGHLEVRLGDG